MTRRSSIFLVAAAVVVLYFSVILFILKPLHGGKRSMYGGGYMNHFDFRQISSLYMCKELRWRSPRSKHVTALVSFPGSGNTWLRYLLQQATGILTGSIYMDYGLKVHGFPAENVTDGSVLVVKTHELPPQDKFSSAVLLVRNPRDAILADFNREHKGHIGTLPKTAFIAKIKQKKKSVWAKYVSSKLPLWEALHHAWLSRFRGPVHLVFYERLVRDTRATLLGILNFLNVTISEPDMDCAIYFKEGIYRRRKKHKDFDPFTPEMYSAIDTVKVRVMAAVNEYNAKHNRTLV